MHKLLDIITKTFSRVPRETFIQIIKSLNDDTLHKLVYHLFTTEHIDILKIILSLGNLNMYYTYEINEYTKTPVYIRMGGDEFSGGKYDPEDIDKHYQRNNLTLIEYCIVTGRVDSLTLLIDSGYILDEYDMIRALGLSKSNFDICNLIINNICLTQISENTINLLLEYEHYDFLRILFLRGFDFSSYNFLNETRSAIKCPIKLQRIIHFMADEIGYNFHNKNFETSGMEKYIEVDKLLIEKGANIKYL